MGFLICGWGKKMTGYCTRCKALTEYTRNGSEENVCRQIAGANCGEILVDSVTCKSCGTTFIGGKKPPYQYNLEGKPQNKTGKNTVTKKQAVA